MTTQPGESLEADLAAIEADVDAALKTAAAVVKELKGAKTAASRGIIRDLQKSLASVPDLAQRLADDGRRLRSEADIDVSALMATGAYMKELLAVAAAENVGAEEQDGTLLCYPSVVRLHSSDQTVSIDKRREKRLRPSVLVGLLKANQEKKPQFKPEQFIESLFDAYELRLAAGKREMGATVKLTEIHGVFTMLPTQRKEYPVPDFTRDIYLLDESKIVTTKKGLTMTLPASAMTRSGGLPTVTKTGQRKVYAGISFT